MKTVLCCWVTNENNFVLLGTVLFHSDIKYNIAYGNTASTEKQIVAAANAADVHDKIVSFPQGKPVSFTFTRILYRGREFFFPFVCIFLTEVQLA